jgi:hypothetical protein
MIRETFRKFTSLFVRSNSSTGPAVAMPGRAPRLIKDPVTHQTRLSGAFRGIVKVSRRGHTNHPDPRTFTGSGKVLRMIKAFRRLGVSKKMVKP